MEINARDQCAPLNGWHGSKIRVHKQFPRLDSDIPLLHTTFALLECSMTFLSSAIPSRRCHVVNAHAPSVSSSYSLIVGDDQSFHTLSLHHQIHHWHHDKWHRYNLLIDTMGLAGVFTFPSSHALCGGERFLWTNYYLVNDNMVVLQVWHAEMSWPMQFVGAGGHADFQRPIWTVVITSTCTHWHHQDCCPNRLVAPHLWMYWWYRSLFRGFCDF